MKTIEEKEKAKAYDEAIERAKEINREHSKKGFKISDDVLYIFPELKESEDEKIRKALIDGFKRYDDGSLFNGCLVREILAWLEKQGNLMKALQISNARIGELIEENYYLKEQFENQGKNNMGISEATKQELEDNLNKALEKETPESCNEFLDKQGEQKHIDKVEPKFKAGDTIRLKNGDGLEWTVEKVLNNGYYTIVCADRDDFIQLDDNWELVEQKPVECGANSDKKVEVLDEYKKGFECGKQYVIKYPQEFNLQPKQEWGEEDIEDELNEWIGCEVCPEGINVSPLPKVIKIVDKTARHFYKLCLKKQKPVEWSEKDKYMLNNIIDTLRPLSETTHSGYAINSMIAWLKSLKNRYSWKPSEEQIE